MVVFSVLETVSLMPSRLVSDFAISAIRFVLIVLMASTPCFASRFPDAKSSLKTCKTS